MHALRQRVRIIVLFSFILSPSNCVIEYVIPLGFASNNAQYIVGTWKNKDLSACNGGKKKSDKINNKKFKDQDFTSNYCLRIGMRKHIYIYIYIYIYETNYI